MDNKIDNNFDNKIDNYTPVSTLKSGSSEDRENKAPHKDADRRSASRHDLVFAAVAALCCVALTDMVLWNGCGIGFSVIALILFAADQVFLKKGSLMGVYPRLVAVCFFLLSVSLVFSDHSFSKFLAVCSMIILYNISLTDRAHLRSIDDGSFRTVRDFFHTFISLGFAGMSDSMWALFHKSGNDGASRRKFGAVLIGTGLAIPALCVIIPLLVSSDAAFEGLISTVTFDKTGEIIASVIFGALLFIFLFSQSFAARYGVRKDVVEDDGTDSDKDKPSGQVDPVIITSFMSVISIAYILYLFSQLAYFFNAFSGILEQGYTLAQYARRGFFEMCAVCVLNLTVVFICTVLTEKKNGKLPKAVRSVSIFICMFSALLISTAISKMVLYIRYCGMTHLRIYTSAFMIFLAAVFVSVILRLFSLRIPYMKITAIAGVLIVCIMTFADVDGIIARHNVNAYLSGELSGIDMDTLRDLSSDAVVSPLIKLCDAKDENVSATAKDILANKRMQKFYVATQNDRGEWEITEKSSVDIRSFNIPSYIARKLLRDNFDIYKDSIEDTHDLD